MSYYSKLVEHDLENIKKENLNFDYFKNKNILVTGANGMLARYFIYFLMYLNDKDNMNIKIYALSKSKEKLERNFLEQKRNDIIPIIQDVCDEIKIDDKVDLIVHLASSANPKTIASDPISIIKSNVFGTLNVLELAKEKQALVIFSSTREIYGKMDESIKFIKEDDMGSLECFDTRACYPESKRMAETILVNYHAMYHVNFKNLRIAHVYGPGMNINRDGRIMSDLIENAVKKQDIVLKSKGEAKRAFCYLTDAISAILYVIIKGNENETYNIANETEEIKISDLANLITQIYKEDGIKVKYVIKENNNLYTKFKRVGLDTSKLESLGWKPKISLKDGIMKTVDFYVGGKQ